MLRTPCSFILSFAVAGCVFGDDRSPDDEGSPIVGGRDATIDELPWQISLQDDSFGHFCGGSILDEEWILTAQHCAEFSNASAMRVVAGIDALSAAGSGQTRSVAEVHLFPGYVDPTSGKDVALLKLAQPLQLDGVRAVAIELVDPGAAGDGVTDPGVFASVSGWGSLSAGGPSPDQLQVVEVPIVSNEDAQAAYTTETITADQLAAGFLVEGGKDSCQGDSGGPLVVPAGSGSGMLLAGVVSWGFGCADPNAPGMYARVSEFHGWIQELRGGDTGGDGRLVINEILADPPSGFDANNDGVASTTQDEFIELINSGDDDLDLSGASVSDAIGVRGRLPDGTVLAPGQALLVFSGGAPTDLDVPAVTFRLRLNNAGDTVTVTGADGTVLATASYGSEGGRDESLVRSEEGQESPFVGHGEVSDAPASPGTRADGSPL